MQKLGFDVEGDAEDQKDSLRIQKCPTGAETPLDLRRVASKERPLFATSEKLIDWRNKSQNRKLARSVVGTSQYMAPEVIRGELYDGRCD